MNLTFRSDTKHRKQFFTGVSFSHPAKMLLPLELWLIENYTKPGDVILDPMAGSGTVLVACSMGRHVIAVELEQKFVDMMKGNWQKIQERGPMLGCQMGKATIIQGDARNLEGLLVDRIITSPPYGELANEKKNTKSNVSREERLRRAGFNPSEFMGGTGRNCSLEDGMRYSKDPENIGNLSYGSIDSIITSPPYEGQMDGGSRHTKGGIPERDKTLKRLGSYDTTDKNNIGSMYNDCYLSAMLQVYRSCFAALRPGGLLILVVKNFIRNKQIVRLDEDTIKLCEKAGFTFQERHYRKLTQESFWRVIYRQKFPDAPVLDTEDILIFMKLEK